MIWRVMHNSANARNFFSSRSRHTSSYCDWSSDVCSSDLGEQTIFHLNGDGKPLSITTAQGNNSSYVYDYGGNLVESTSPLGAKWRFRYDTRGFLTSAIEIGRASCRERGYV